MPRSAWRGSGAKPTRRPEQTGATNAECAAEADSTGTAPGRDRSRDGLSSQSEACRNTSGALTTGNHVSLSLCRPGWTPGCGGPDPHPSLVEVF